VVEDVEEGLQWDWQSREKVKRVWRRRDWSAELDEDDVSHAVLGGGMLEEAV
jgi:hypothetical protein